MWTDRSIHILALCHCVVMYWEFGYRSPIHTLFFIECIDHNRKGFTLYSSSAIILTCLEPKCDNYLNLGAGRVSLILHSESGALRASLSKCTDIWSTKKKTMMAENCNRQPCGQNDRVYEPAMFERELLSMDSTTLFGYCGLICRVLERPSTVSSWSKVPTQTTIAVPGKERDWIRGT